MSIKKQFQSITGEILHKSSLFGGDINQVEKWVCQNGIYAVKSHHAPPPGFFQKEAQGLRLLEEAGLPVPRVEGFCDQGLLMKYYQPVEDDANDEFARQAGRQLAKLHLNKKNSSGLDHDNYIGLLPQKNNLTARWSDFYCACRLEPMLNLYKKNNNVNSNEQGTWERLFQKMEELVSGVESVLLHGDLWSGNLMYTDQGPLFIDPAAYYGDYRVELAFTELFGGFGSSFYEGYSEVKPIDSDYQGLKKLYQIYPLLVHANLFGGGYYHSAYTNVKMYV